MSQENIKRAEQNPKQILIDWVDGVSQCAKEGQHFIKKSSENPYTRLNKVQNYLSQILGLCQAMDIVLKNST